MMIFRPGQRLIVPGVQVFQPRVTSAAASGILDGISNVAAAYSLRKLRSAYAGSAVRVRRSSDSTEQDIGFDGTGEFDSAAFSAFVGGGTGYVKTWYDQGVSGRDATQTTTTKQPSITLSAVNSKATLSFDGTDDVLVYASNVTVGAALVLANYATTPFSSYAGLIGGTTALSNQIGFTASSGSTQFFEETGVTFRTKIRANNGTLTLNFATLTTHKIVSGSAEDTADTWNGIQIGSDRNNVSRYWLGNVAECIVLSAAISTADHNTIGADMATRFGLSWTTVT